jgi:GNAT superfamily N-acetyltransferase/NTP pyrophosphatase (non-canonical NTP hydrolase)
MNQLIKLLELERDARQFGFDWPDQFMILDQIVDECREVREDIVSNSTEDKIQEEVGDLLHAVISLCVFSGFSIESIIEKTNAKFAKRMSLLKQLTQKYGLENLHGQSIEFMLKLWGEVKTLECDASIKPKFTIRVMSVSDLPTIVSSFNQIGWNKSASLFEKYLAEAKTGARFVWIAHMHDQFAGYVTLNWQSEYKSFKEQNIPEVMDLNVLPAFRKCGLGSLLLNVAEKEAATKSDTVGIGVGLVVDEKGGYGPAQRLYVKRGYIPDGKGLTHNYQLAVAGHSYALDDNLVLWFTKKLN